MASSLDLNKLGFEDFESYFDYIIESIANGQHKQARDFFSELDTEQKRRFVEYKEEMYPSISIKTIIS